MGDKYQSTSDVILEKRDAAFIETWEERKARKPRPKKTWEERKTQKQEYDRVRHERGRVRLKPLASGVLIDAAFIKRAEKLYNGEMAIKRIAIEMGCGTNTITRLRREFNWPSRKGRLGFGKNNRTERSFHLPKSVLDAMDRHIFGRYRSRSAYVRRLIERDLGL